MELIFKWENIIFFKYLERFNLRVIVKSASLEVLGLMHLQSKFSSLFKKLSSNHPEQTRYFLKLSANIDVPCLFRCSLPLFKQDTSILLLSIKSKPLLRQYFWSLSFTAIIPSVLSTSSRAKAYLDLYILLSVHFCRFWILHYNYCQNLK